MATGNKQAGEWMSPDYNEPAKTMKRVADLGPGGPTNPPDDTSWIQDDIGPGDCKPRDVYNRAGRTGA